MLGNRISIRQVGVAFFVILGLLAVVMNLMHHQWWSAAAYSLSAAAAALSVAFGFSDAWAMDEWKLLALVALLLSVVAICKEEYPKVSEVQSAAADLHEVTSAAVLNLSLKGYSATDRDEINRANFTCQRAVGDMGGWIQAVWDSLKALYLGPIATMLDWLYTTVGHESPTIGQRCYVSYAEIRSKYPSVVPEASDHAKKTFGASPK